MFVVWYREFFRHSYDMRIIIKAIIRIPINQSVWGVIKILGFDKEYSDSLWADMADISECNFCMNFSCKQKIYTARIMVVVLDGQPFLKCSCFVPISTSGFLFSIGQHRSFSRLVVYRGSLQRAFAAALWSQRSCLKCIENYVERVRYGWLEEILHQLRLVVYPTIEIQFYTSQVVQDFFHQQYGCHFVCITDYITSFQWICLKNYSSVIILLRHLMVTHVWPTRHENPCTKVHLLPWVGGAGRTLPHHVPRLWRWLGWGSVHWLAGTLEVRYLDNN